MGIHADNMAEVVQRQAGDYTIELRAAATVELISTADGLVTVNVDGVLALRIQATSFVTVDTTLLDAAFKMVSP